MEKFALGSERTGGRKGRSGFEVRGVAPSRGSPERELGDSPSSGIRTRIPASARILSLIGVSPSARNGVSDLGERHQHGDDSNQRSAAVVIEPRPEIHGFRLVSSLM